MFQKNPQEKNNNKHLQNMDNAQVIGKKRDWSDSKIETNGEFASQTQENKKYLKNGSATSKLCMDFNNLSIHEDVSKFSIECNKFQNNHSQKQKISENNEMCEEGENFQNIENRYCNMNRMLNYLHGNFLVRKNYREQEEIMALNNIYKFQMDDPMEIDKLYTLERKRIRDLMMGDI